MSPFSVKLLYIFLSCCSTPDGEDDSLMSEIGRSYTYREREGSRSEEVVWKTVLSHVPVQLASFWVCQWKAVRDKRLIAKRSLYVSSPRSCPTGPLEVWFLSFGNPGFFVLSNLRMVVASYSC